MDILARVIATPEYNGKLVKVDVLDNILTISFYNGENTIKYDKEGNPIDIPEIPYIETLLSKQNIDLNLLFENNSLYEFYLNENEESPKLFDAIKVPILSNHTREDVYRTSTAKKLGQFPFMGLYFHDSIDNSYLSFNYPVSADTDNLILRGNDTLYSYLKKNCAGFNEIAVLNDAKQEIVMSLNPNNSLSYLEAQIDILTSIVFKILEVADPSLREEIKTAIPELDLIETSLKTTSVLSIKTVDKCLEEFSTGKLTTRTLQKAYYDKKNKYK